MKSCKSDTFADEYLIRLLRLFILHKVEAVGAGVASGR